MLSSPGGPSAAGPYDRVRSMERGAVGMLSRGRPTTRNGRAGGAGTRETPLSGSLPGLCGLSALEEA
jgi:hypothetical protein